MSLSDLSASTQNYLKAMWWLQERTGESSVAASAIASKVGVRTSTVSDALKKLKAQGLVEHSPYGAVTLTDAGLSFAQEMIRRHRLIETFLVETLDYTWAQVHDEAEELEHAVSDFLIERMDEKLGYPVLDPHGDPIPRSGSRHVELLKGQRPLAECTPGATVTVRRISDEDPGLLQFLAENGVCLGAALTVGESQPFSDDVRIQLGEHSLVLGVAARRAIWVKEA